ncbi:heterokaryon incompatibility protein-domain-containing protein [Nemania sp. FL0916]|nr:heterokaryon incompatibility protein-domain-containing protein [Nemania sp. FL0916]
MRLLDTKLYRLVESNDVPSPFPPYAILSHTWISPKDEITYQDFKQRKSDIENDIFKQKGWAKLRKYCDRAARDGWDWAWMDTCCIDKTNPADTQEAINAMFRWYQNASICYAYLEDVDANEVSNGSDPNAGGVPVDQDLDDASNKNNVANPDSDLRQALKKFLINAKWFTRGWTLQELLAPPYLVFVDCAWRRMGTRESWAAEIEKASNIDAKHLTSLDPGDFMSCSIAMRLSWASGRETTVEEDETYSLLGLFGISLPLIYGEGRLRAFNRLQRELITVYNDDSIFAWKAVNDRSESSGVLNRGRHSAGRGILAPSIREFWDSSQIECFGLYGNSFTMTNRGLELQAKRWMNKIDPVKCVVCLNCGNTEEDLHIGIPLSRNNDSYERIQVDELCNVKSLNSREWQLESGNQSTFIRAGGNTNYRIPSSLFTLEIPESITIGEKYYVNYADSMFRLSSLARFNNDSSALDLRSSEFFVKPDQIVFVNISLSTGESRSELDIVMNVSKNGFPSAGIIPRGTGIWKRPGDPLEGSLRKYDSLAVYLHEKLPPVYPNIACIEDKAIVISICLLPRPPLKRTSVPPVEEEKSIVLREYTLKVTISRDSNNDDGNARILDDSRKRKHDERG